MIKHKFLI